MSAVRLFYSKDDCFAAEDSYDLNLELVKPFIAFPDDEHSRQVIAEAKRDLAYFDGSGDFVYSAVEDLAVSLRALIALIELDGEEKK